MIPQLLLGLALVWLFYSSISLARNFRRAQAMGVPLIAVPVSPMNVLWIVIEPLVFRILDSLPFSVGSFGHYGRRGWHFHDKAASHVKLGDAFALVTPRETFLHICDPDAINDIFARRLDFVRPVQLYSKLSLDSRLNALTKKETEMMNIFGANVATVSIIEPSVIPAHHLFRSDGQSGNARGRLSLLLSTRTQTRWYGPSLSARPGI